MNRTPIFCKLHNKSTGQSLVETALFLPIILFLMAGALEVSNLLITQNRVQTAARAGTGFGATNYDVTIPIADTFEAMSMVALNNVTQTVELEPERWDIYTVKATINDDASDFDEWIWDRPYGLPDGTEAVYPESVWTANEPQTKQDVLDAFDATTAAGMEIVATVAYHNRDSFLGLGYFDPGLTRIRGLTVMRISETQGNNDGCDLFPITLRIENLSLYPENYAGSMAAGGRMYDSSEYEGGNTNIVPDHDYNDSPYDHTGFPFAQGGHPLVPDSNQPRRGDIFEVREVDGPGGFGWLSWTGDTDSPELADNLEPPGRLTLVYPAPPGYVNYVNPDNADDYVPSIGDWVQNSTGNMNSNAVLFWVDDHIDSERQIQILVFDQVRGTGSSLDYRIAGFAQVILRGRKSIGSEKYLLVEFIRWADPCYAEPAP